MRATFMYTTKTIRKNQALLEFIIKLGRMRFFSASWEASNKADKIKTGVMLTEDYLCGWTNDPSQEDTLHIMRGDKVIPFDWVKTHLPDEGTKVTIAYMKK